MKYYKNFILSLLIAISMTFPLTSCASENNAQSPTTDVQSTASVSELISEQVSETAVHLQNTEIIEDQSETSDTQQLEIQITDETTTNNEKNVQDIDSENHNPIANGQLTVHFIDVGQADSIFIQLPNDETLLIDAGNNNDDDIIMNYLNALNVTEIDYLVGTHPHEDHIGAMDDIVANYEIGAIYMPQVTSNTKTFEDLLLTIDSEGLSINTVKGNVELFKYDNLRAYFIAPNNNDYSDLNDYSAVLKLVYNDVSFLFTGDAETVSETEILNNNYDIKSNVLKVGHHGSDSSSSNEFLKMVAPQYAIISCGVDNSYGHPTNDVLERLNSYDIGIFRTDLQGTIIVSTDGETLHFNQKQLDYIDKLGETEPKEAVVDEPSQKTIETSSESSKPIEENKSLVVYVTKTGEKYHLGNCSYLSKSKIEINLQDAINRGFTPCSRCKP